MRGRRYPTYLWPRGSDRQPARMGSLAVAVSAPPAGENASSRIVTLSRWDVEVWSALRGIARRVHRLSSASAADWWLAMGELLEWDGRLTVLCPGVVHTLALLGAWGRIDRGEVTLERVPLLLSDPPTSLVLRLPDRPGRLHMLDTRNYGVDISPGEEACERTGNFARSMCAALGRARMGALQDTAGAQALYGYRKSYMPTGLQTHCRPRVLALERAALHGGRAECHRLGRVEGPIYALDYTGYYTSIMRDLAVPIRLRHRGDEWLPHGPALLCEGVPMLARVKVRTEWPSYPCLKDGLTVWPVGTFWVTLCGTELRRAWGTGEIVDGGPWATYDTAPHLSAYAQACLELRAEAERDGDKDLARWAKSLGVCLAGKWAQTRRVWTPRGRVEARYRWGAWWYLGLGGQWQRYRSLAGRVEREDTAGETDTSFPAISAWIYAEGRARLWETMLAAGRDEVYYTHTDSLFLSEIGYRRLLDAGMIGTGEPGKLRLCAVWEWMEILGISHYRVPGRTVCSGVVGSGGVGGESAPGGYYPESVGSALAGRHPPQPVEYRGPPEAIRPYRHGVRGADGRVSPWRME